MIGEILKYDNLHIVEDFFDFVVLKEFYDGPLAGFSRINFDGSWVYFSKIWWSEDQNVRLFSITKIIDANLVKKLEEYSISKSGREGFSHDEFAFSSSLDLTETLKRSPNAFAFGENLSRLAICVAGE